MYFAKIGFEIKIVTKLKHLKSLNNVFIIDNFEIGKKVDLFTDGSKSKASKRGEK